MFHDYAEKIYWDPKSRVLPVWCAIFILMVLGLVVTYYSVDREKLGFYGFLVLLVLVVVFVCSFVLPVAIYSSKLVGAAPVQSYISEEYHLAGMGYAREQVGEGSGKGGALYYASEVKIENVSMLQYVRRADDGAMTFHTWPMNEVKIYESDTQTPVERHHHTRKVLVNPFTGEEEYVDDQFDYLEFTVPVGSVARNYGLSVNGGN